VQKNSGIANASRINYMNMHPNWSHSARKAECHRTFHTRYPAVKHSTTIGII